MSAPLHAMAEFVAQHGYALLFGTTLLLAVFAVLVRVSRSPTTKNLLASSAMLAALGYLIIALIPLPRYGIAWLQPATTNPGLLEPASQPLPTTKLLFDEQLFVAQHEGPTERPLLGQPTFAAAPLPSRKQSLASKLALEVASTVNPTPASSRNLAMWLAITFLLGCALFLGHLLLGWWHLRRILGNSQPASTALTQFVELPARARLRITKLSVQPFCCGLLRPTIVLPQDLATASDATRFVLMHERAHLISGDTRARLVAALLRPLLFWHPLYWWLQRQLRFTSEVLADDAAAQGSVAAYVRCMMALSTHQDRAAGGVLVATIFQRKSELFRRLEMMLQRNESITHSQSLLSRGTRAIASLALLTVCAGTFGVEHATAQSPPGEAVRAQVRELKAELARLRQEIAEQNQAGRSNRLRGKPAALLPATVPAQSPAPRPPKPASATRSKRRATTNNASDSPSAPLSIHDLAELVTRCIELRGDIEIQQLQARRAGSDDTIQAAKIKLQSKESQLATLRSLLEQELHAAEKEVARNTLLHKQGLIPTSALQGPQSKRNLLQGFLSAEPAKKGALAGIAKRPASGAATNETTSPRTAATSSHGLADLVTRYLELRGDVEIQEVNVQHASSDAELQVAKIKLRTAQSQHQALRSLLEQELQAGEQHLARTIALHKQGFIPTSELQATESKLMLLRRSLQ